MKYFLLCQNCAHPNEVNSEFLTFCNNCKKKLHINFREWKHDHPDKGFDDYKADIGIPENNLATKTETSAVKRPLVIWPYVVLTSLSLFFLTLYLFPSIYKNSVLVMFVQDELNEKDFKWTEEVHGAYGLSIDSPVELEKIDVKVPPQQRGLLEDIEAFHSNINASVAIMAVSTRFNPRIGSVNLQASITSFVNQVRMLPDISNFQLKQEETSVSGVKGFGQKGSFLRKGKPMKFESIGVSEGFMLWQVMVVYEDRNETAEDASKRIMESIKILYNTGA